MRLQAIRINKGKDLKQAIAEVVETENITAGIIVGAAGSLSQARIRMAGAAHTDDSIREYKGNFEIVSLMGMCNGSMHLHISISDAEGRVIGGHLKDGCIVHTTTELFILIDETQRFTRETDPETGFEELKVGPA